MIYNLWIGASKDMAQQLKRLVMGNYDVGGDDALTYPELYEWDGPTIALFRSFIDSDLTENSFRRWGANDYRQYSVYATKPDKVQVIRDQLQMLMDAHPNEFSVNGVWRFDTGAQAGSPPWFPQPPQLINFMPDLWNGSEFVTAPAVRDVHLLLGQAPRQFD